MSDRQKVVVERRDTVIRVRRYEVEVVSDTYGEAVAATQHLIDNHFTQFVNDLERSMGTVLSDREEPGDEPTELLMVDPDHAKLIPFPEGGKR